MPKSKFFTWPGKQLPGSFLAWRIVQTVVWLIGAGILFCLLFFPLTGILLFWNILIPVAPALLVVATGVWRNVCPLATTQLLPRHLGLSKRKKLTSKQLGMLNLAGALLLYAIVPLRHAIFNTNGVATALLIISMAVAGIVLGFFYEWKSAWCSGLCPIHGVEKLYGGNVLITTPNAHCDKCMNCVVPCPDSTPNIHPKSSTKTIYHRISGLLIIGGLPGFIWGWFHVPDKNAITTLGKFISVYEMPLIGLAVTIVAYGILSAIVKPKLQRRLTGFFAALGVSCYYWYRIPALFGFGPFGSDGLLINLKGTLSPYSILMATIAAIVFFFYCLVIRKPSGRSWSIRPEYASKQDRFMNRAKESKGGNI